MSRRSICGSWTFRACGSISPSRSTSSKKTFRRRPGLRRLQHPRLAGDQRERHARRARSPKPPSSIRSPRMPTLAMICNIQDPITREDYTRDPRNIARKAVNYLKSTGIADTAYIGPELEFFIFDDVRFDQNAARRLLPHRQHRRRLEPRPRREARTSATSSATRKAISPSRRPTS